MPLAIFAVALLALGLGGCPTDSNDGNNNGNNTPGSGSGKAAAPTASPAAGAVVGGTAISLATTTSGANIYYTTDGGTPSTASTEYSDSSKPVISAAAAIKAIAVKDGISLQKAAGSGCIVLYE